MQTSQKNRPINVLLVGNYTPDKQFSMRRFAEQLQEALRIGSVKCEVFLPPVFFGKILPSNQGLGKWLGYIDKYLLCPFFLKCRIKRLPKGSVVHICDHSNAIYTKVLAKRPHLLTCHDLLAVRSALGEIPQNKPKWTGRQQQAMILRGLKRCRMIASVSLATQQDVTRIVGDEAKWRHHISNSLDPKFIEDAKRAPGSVNREQMLQELKLPAGIQYVLHIGGEKWYKNRKGALQIYTHLARERQNLHLLIIGPKFSEETLKETGAVESVGRIHYLTGVSDQSLRDIYNASELLLFPSLMEGFGWPILEAQACGCPVVTLDVEPMRSLNAVGELTVTVDGSDGDCASPLAEACTRHFELSAEKKLERSHLVKRFASEFASQTSAHAYIKLYEALIEEDS